MREWRQDAVTGLSSSDADIRDAGRVLQVLRDTRPEWIVLSAAYTDVDGCESNAEFAFAVNRDGAVNVASGGKRGWRAPHVPEFRLCFRRQENNAV